MKPYIQEDIKRLTQFILDNAAGRPFIDKDMVDIAGAINAYVAQYSPEEKYGNRVNGY